MKILFCLQDGTTARCWVIVCADLVLVAIDVVNMAVAFPFVVHLGDGDKFNCLPLKKKRKKKDNQGFMVFRIHFLLQRFVHI